MLDRAQYLQSTALPPLGEQQRAKIRNTLNTLLRRIVFSVCRETVRLHTAKTIRWIYQGHDRCVSAFSFVFFIRP